MIHDLTTGHSAISASCTTTGWGTSVASSSAIFCIIALNAESPAAEEGNPALLDKVFFFTDYFSLGCVQ